MAKVAVQSRGKPAAHHRRKSPSVSQRIWLLKSSAIRELNNAESRERLTSFLYWICLLLSLTPLVLSFKGVFGSFAIWGLVAEGATSLPGWVADPKFGVFLALAGLMISCAVILRAPAYILASLTPVIAAFLGLTQPSQDIFIPLTLSYVLFAAVSLTVFGVKGRFLSAPVAIFAIFTFFDSIAITFFDIIQWVSAHVFGGSTSAPERHDALLSGYILDDYGANIVDLVSFFVLLVTLRFTVHLIKDNRQIVSQLWSEREKAKDALLKALRMWWPLLATFVVLTVWVYPKFDAFVQNRTMTWLQNMLVCEPVSEAAPGCVPYDPARTTLIEFEPMMRLLVEYSAIQMESSANQAIQEIANQTIETADDLKHKIYPILAQKVLPPRMPGTQTSGCGRMNIPCHAANGVKSLANSGYRRLRDPPLRALSHEIDTAYAAANGNVDAFRSQSAQLIQEEMRAYRTRANIAIDKSIYGMKLMATFSFLYSVMVLIKTYGIAFSRVIFDHRSPYELLACLYDSATDTSTDEHQSSADEGATGSRKSPTKHRSSIEKSAIAIQKDSPLMLAPEDGLDYYIQSSRQVSSGLSFPSIPFPFKAINKRVLAKNYAMQFYNLTEDGTDPVGLQFEPTERMISIRVRSGDKFIFDFPAVVAFSSGVKVSTFVTLSLHGLVFGRALYRIAEGDGIMVLCLSGEPTVLNTNDHDSPEVRRDAKSFVAWRLDTPFKIQSKLSIKGLLASGYNIAKQQGGAVVLHNNQITGGASKMGIARFVRTFLSPV